MPVENNTKLAYYQDPDWDDPGTKLDKDAVVNAKTGEVNHLESAGCNLMEAGLYAPFRALGWGNTFDGFFKNGNLGKGILLDVWEIVGLPVIIAKDLVDAAAHGIAAGFSKPKASTNE